MKAEKAVLMFWPDIPSRYTYDHLLKVFKYFDKNIYQNRDMLKPEGTSFSYRSIHGRLSEAIDKAMTLSLNQEQTSEIIDLCKKFCSEGWVLTNKIKELEQWIKYLTGQHSMKTQDNAIDSISFVGGIKKNIKRKQLTMNPDISGKKCPPGSGRADAQVVRQSGFICQKQQHKKVITSPLTREKNPVIKSKSASPYDNLFDQIAFNPFTNKAIQHLIPSRERLGNILEDGNIFYHQLQQDLQERKETGKEVLNQQLIAREWLDILTSNPWLLEALKSDEKKQCAIIINLATERLLDKMIDLPREQSDTYFEIIKEETALLQNIQICLKGLSNANIEVDRCLRTRSKVIEVRCGANLLENRASQATNREIPQLSQTFPPQKGGDRAICQSAIGASSAQPASNNWAAMVKKALLHNEERSAAIEEVKIPFSYQASPPPEWYYPDPTGREIEQFLFKKSSFEELQYCFEEVDLSSPEAIECQKMAAFNWLQAVLVDEETIWRNLLIETQSRARRYWCMASLTRLVHWTLAVVMTVDYMDQNQHRNHAQLLKEVIAFIPMISSLDRFIDFMSDPDCYTGEKTVQCCIIDTNITKIRKIRNKIRQAINNVPLSPSIHHVLDNELYCHQILKHFSEGSAQRISSKAYQLLKELLQESPEKRSLTNKKYLPALIFRLFSIGLDDLKQEMLAVSSGKMGYNADQVSIKTNQLNKALNWLSSCRESLPVDIREKLDQQQLELITTGGFYTSLLPPTVLSQIDVLLQR